MSSKQPALSVFLQHRSELVAYASKLVGCPHRAEDVVQEAFVKFDKVSSNNVFDRPVAYLFRIVRNLAIDSLRVRAREDKVFCPESEGEDIADTACDPEVIALYKSEMDQMYEVLNELPERTRQAVLLHRVRGFKLKEIAETLDISIGLAHTLVCNGVEHCKSRLLR